ncbi:hypothetical protein AAJP47_04565 [Psychrobacter sp. B38]|uniref:hypothetical protein n=1 Tax=Psychrobacter sp. B38 TaxID=3143538 RepID=UPI00320FC924
MNHKKIPAQFQQKWWLAIVLVALLIGYVGWKIISTDTATSPAQNTDSVAQSTEAAPNASTPSDETGLNEEALSSEDSSSTDPTLNDSALDERDENIGLSDTSNGQIPSPKAILNAPLPQTDSLAKEEIDRLEDERQRLAEQEKLAAEQLAMNKQLTDMKAEQIALLEQQIAQLEAEDSAVE